MAEFSGVRRDACQRELRLQLDEPRLRIPDTLTETAVRAAEDPVIFFLSWFVEFRSILSDGGMCLPFLESGASVQSCHPIPGGCSNSFCVNQLCQRGERC